MTHEMCELTCSGAGVGRCAIPPPPPPLSDPPTDCTPDASGTQYNGTLAQTWSGRTCQAWASDFPQNHSYEHRDAVENYCRNLWGDSGALWCYTTDPAWRWDFCYLPTCPPPLPPLPPLPSSSPSGSDSDSGVAIGLGVGLGLALLLAFGGLFLAFRKGKFKPTGLPSVPPPRTVTVQMNEHQPPTEKAAASAVGASNPAEPAQPMPPHVPETKV